MDHTSQWITCHNGSLITRITSHKGSLTTGGHPSQGKHSLKEYLPSQGDHQSQGIPPPQGSLITVIIHHRDHSSQGDYSSQGITHYKGNAHHKGFTLLHWQPSREEQQAQWEHLSQVMTHHKGNAHHKGFTLLWWHPSQASITSRTLITGASPIPSESQGIQLLQGFTHHTGVPMAGGAIIVAVPVGYFFHDTGLRQQELSRLSYPLPFSH